jgi:hypothetical protein
MATLLQKILRKSRFLLVAGLVMTLLSLPVVSQAGWYKQSKVIIESATSTIAGLETEIAVEGQSYEPIEVAITKPDGKQIILETVSDASGHAQVNVSDYHLREAGQYTAEARHLSERESYGFSKNFTVHPGTVSSEATELTFSKNTIKAGETAEVSAKITDAYGNEVQGHVLRLIPSSAALSSYSPDYATDKNGEMKFYITGEEKGIVSLSLFDSSANKTLASGDKLAVLDGPSDYLSRGGDDNSWNIWLASTSGEINTFEITGLEEVEASESLSLTVTAVDSDGTAVTDYTGTVRFSSSDTNATMPSDYTFLADDQGEHTFSLGFKFLTVGSQTLTTTDTDNTAVQIESNFTVSGDGSYDEEYETEDYEREGDFTLISPASGIYGSADVEVQGEADYGYSAVIYIDEEEAGRVEIEYDNSFTYTVQDLSDGTYELYVDIVELGDGEAGEEEILEVIETSDSESISIDTTAPEIRSTSTDPEGPFAKGEVIEITVLTESDLEEAYLLFQEEIFELTETSTSGKYQAEIQMPETEADYAVDIVLMDELGNEVQYRDELALTVSTEASSSGSSSVSGIGQVTGLTTTADEASVILSWEAAESENSIANYRVYYGPAPDMLYAISDTYDSSTTWMITNLAGEEYYYFAVSAVDVEGNEGEASDVISSMALSKEGSDTSGDVPTGDSSSAITDSGTPDETPETGPASTALILVSLLGAAGYSRVRR